jgi:Cu/Zn superoxide dismutase
MVLTIAANPDGTALLSTRVRGYKLDGPDGVIGKAVVLHEANGTLEARPDVPNGRIACGVIAPMRALSF